ncbi:fatty-acid amide hydrolase 2-A [Trichonephila clavipes]|nr:fatty-acid amide hydrolase 2-A [Trichonephila clavipes]
MLLRHFPRQYEQLSQFERGRIIGMKEAGCSARFIRNYCLYKMPMRFWFFHVVCTILRFLVHCALALRYWGKGKKVPKVKNPLLLKSAAKLAEEIREGKIKSEDVIRAYMERILEVEPYINATVDQCFSEALDEAKEVDVLIASGRYSKKQLAEEKPLLGVPISVKVLIIVKDLRIELHPALKEKCGRSSRVV